ncbi:hypothetical protein [Synechococcus lacustris]|uniref:hypothetical protein n=1 Tax=Synechococcus lacustris TaxID=2116544 RepID=UPI0020CE5FD0|nr:hypothetical protein [Synechococcus lacustris]MCP9812212.1 hypothetical protein [Synechococcus lacustris Maggiore-St4-Slac]
MSLSPDSPLPSHYRSKQEFLASLSPWRRQLANLNWHPTVDMKVQSYALEQSTKQLRKENAQIMNETEQLKKENARLAAINSRLDRFEQEHFSSLNQALSTGDSSAS